MGFDVVITSRRRRSLLRVEKEKVGPKPGCLFIGDSGGQLYSGTGGVTALDPGDSFPKADRCVVYIAIG